MKEGLNVMKKILSAMLLILIFSSVSYGAVSQDIYVRQDVFDAKMEALFSRLHGELLEFKNEIRSEISGLKTEIAEIKGDIKTLSERVDGNFVTLSRQNEALGKRIDDTHNYLYWILVFLALCCFYLLSVSGSKITKLLK